MSPKGMCGEKGEFEPGVQPSVLEGLDMYVLKYDDRSFSDRRK
jgi:hypothetical protein